MSLNLETYLLDAYEKYSEKSLIHKRFTHNEILPLIRKFEKEPQIKIDLAGHSIENREIYSLRFGEGSKTVLLWTQMHGDEATATMAVFDILNFLSSQDEFDYLRELFKSNLRLIFVPMLNPDGTERITRQNAVGIDLNRDAKKLQAPESQILLNLVEKYKPDFAFNLHDQDFRWSVGETNKLASISLLAPVYDCAKSIDESRLNAIKLVAELRNKFEHYLPNRIARYKDDFEPRSFGDYIAGQKVSTILIESGRDINDPNKFFYRKLNFTMLLYSFMSISKNQYLDFDESDYFKIPTNGKFMFDLILKNVLLEKEGKKFHIDIAINREEEYETGSRLPFFKSCILDIGDLSVFSGIEEFDCTGLEIMESKILQNTNFNENEINEDKLKEYINSGYLFVQLNENMKTRKSINMPINLIGKDKSSYTDVRLNSTANFFLTTNRKIEKVLINGWLCDLNDYSKVRNGLVY